MTITKPTCSFLLPDLCESGLGQQCTPFLWQSGSTCQEVSFERSTPSYKG